MFLKSMTRASNPRSRILDQQQKTNKTNTTQKQIQIKKWNTHKKQYKTNNKKTTRNKEREKEREKEKTSFLAFNRF